MWVIVKQKRFFLNQCKGRLTPTNPLQPLAYRCVIMNYAAIDVNVIKQTNQACTCFTEYLFRENYANRTDIVLDLELGWNLVSELFDNYMQQDAHEFLNYLLNTVADLLQGRNVCVCVCAWVCVCACTHTCVCVHGVCVTVCAWCMCV